METQETNWTKLIVGALTVLGPGFVIAVAMLARHSAQLENLERELARLHSRVVVLEQHSFNNRWPSNSSMDMEIE